MMQARLDTNWTSRRRGLGTEVAPFLMYPKERTNEARKCSCDLRAGVHTRDHPWQLTIHLDSRQEQPQATSDVMIATSTVRLVYLQN